MKHIYLLALATILSTQANATAKDSVYSWGAWTQNIQPAAGPAVQVTPAPVVATKVNFRPNENAAFNRAAQNTLVNVPPVVVTTPPVVVTTPPVVVTTPPVVVTTPPVVVTTPPVVVTTPPVVVTTPPVVVTTPPIDPAAIAAIAGQTNVIPTSPTTPISPTGPSTGGF